MSYSFTTGNAQTGATAMELVVSVYDQIESGFYEVKRPELLWKTLIPEASVKYDANPGAKSYGYRSTDFRGMGQFVQGDSKNIPRVGRAVGQVTIPMLNAAVGSSLLNSEAEEYMYAFQVSLAQDYGKTMKKAAEYHVERDIIFGNLMAGFLPFIDYPTVTKIPANAWTGTDPTAWVQSITNAIATMYSATKTVHLADTVYLPIAKASLLLNAFVIGSGTAGVAVSAMEYLKKNNMYTLMTGKELNVKVLRYLDGNGVAGADRIILQDTNPENMVLPFPKPYQLSQPVPVALGVEMFAEYKFGSFNLRFPKSMYYLDVAA